MSDRYRLKKEDLRPVAVGLGSCIASNQIPIDGHPVRFMYREPPDDAVDSGWRFFSGLEDEAYSADAANFAIYDVNTIANYDPTIAPLLDAPEGSAFEKAPGSGVFARVEGWAPPED